MEHAEHGFFSKHTASPVDANYAEDVYVEKIRDFKW